MAYNHQLCEMYKATAIKNNNILVVNPFVISIHTVPLVTMMTDVTLSEVVDMNDNDLSHWSPW